LCYTPCNDGYSGNGPICWSDCPSNYPYSCGEVFCAVTSRECTSELAINFKLFKATDLSLFFSGVGFVGSIFGLTSGLVVPQCSLNTTSL